MDMAKIISATTREDRELGKREKTEAFDHQPSIKQARLKTREKEREIQDKEEQEKRILTMNIQQVSAREERETRKGGRGRSRGW